MWCNVSVMYHQCGVFSVLCIVSVVYCLCGVLSVQCNELFNIQSVQCAVLCGVLS